jgi:regulator of cell morphogenesis and NO signaling
METLIDKTIGEIVAEDFRTAAIFSKNRMDFCCGGHKTVKEVCETKNINAVSLEEELYKILNSKNDNTIDFQSWPLDLLTNYIVKTHHRYVEEKTPVLLQFLDKLCKVHGDRHPELFEINRLFNETASALHQHMQKEELVLFPFIENMMEAKRLGKDLANPHFGTVNNPINMMVHEHETEGERLAKIAILTEGYNPPADACNTFRVTYAMLEEFEQDLHKHIHLENNILFPRAIALENTF